MKQSPSPFTPHGSFLERQTLHKRSTVRIALFSILAVHVVLLGALLIGGCRHDVDREEGSGLQPTNAPTPVETNVPVGSVPKPETDLPVMPPAITRTTFPPPIPDVPAPSAATRSYTVVKGDSFHKIAKANHISMSALIQANSGVDTSPLRVGTVLQIPPAAETAPITAPVPAPLANVAPEARTAPPSSSQTIYVVKTGDSLIKIAKARGTTVKALKAANGLKGDRIVPGKKLKIPAVVRPSATPRADKAASLAPAH